MIVNCKELGLDFERASLSDYLEALDFQIAAASGDKPKAVTTTAEDRERLAQVMAART